MHEVIHKTLLGKLHDNPVRHYDLCEARQVLRKPLTERRAYLEQKEQSEGIAARKHLESDMADQHRVMSTWK